MRKLTHAIPALVLIAAGAGLVLAGVTDVRAVSDPGGKDQRIQELNHLDSQFAEMHQRIRDHRACTETGRWDEWPCTKFSPAERP